MKRTVFPNEGTYEIDGVFLSKQDAFDRLPIFNFGFDYLLHVLKYPLLSSYSIFW